MKRKTKLFFKSFYISSLVTFCIVFTVLGMGKAYESIRYVYYGENKSAVEFSRGVLRIFDFEIEMF